MLFNSYIFILLFLPVTLFVFIWLGARGRVRAALTWLVAASLFFYGWWNPAYLGLIIGSMLFNYAVGVELTRRGGASRALLAFGVAANLALLGYYKYANFFLDNVARLTGLGIAFDTIVLPLAISFFTFQQIAYLVDASRGETHEYSFLHYCLFVLFFPQLIAGPIVHHREMLPQFRNPRVYRLDYENLAVGITIFAIGLFKKVVIADNAALHATPVFNAAAQGAALSLFEAWSGALAYTFQLYFDFSGYSDMAIGLGRLFGIRLPVNFYSPYKATSIIDFWRRWHITLSRFLRDYLYIPLGGNRRGPARRHANLLVTMLLGGLWHGAGWTFVFWGGLHGIYLIVNHGWLALRRAVRPGARASRFGRWAARLLTFLAVVVAWVFFRAESFEVALVMVRAMAGFGGVLLPFDYRETLGALAPFGVRFGNLAHDGAWPLLLVLWLLVWFAPNTLEIMRRYRPALARYPGAAPAAARAPVVWRATPLWMLAIAGLLLASLVNMGKVSEFLYFQF